MTYKSNEYLEQIKLLINCNQQLEKYKKRQETFKKISSKKRRKEHN